MLTLRAVVFSFLIPGTVACIIPFILASSYPATVNLGLAKYTGFILIAAGVFCYLASLLRFILEGKGTPAIWFTRKLKSVIGEEPILLVRRGIYRYSRNPMYLGVISVVTGTGVLLQSPAILVYTVILFVLFHCVVVFIEEPHLKRKFGESYESYLAVAPRWFGKRRKAGFLKT